MSSSLTGAVLHVVQALQLYFEAQFPRFFLGLYLFIEHYPASLLGQDPAHYPGNLRELPSFSRYFRRPPASRELSMQHKPEASGVSSPSVTASVLVPAGRSHSEY